MAETLNREDAVRRVRETLALDGFLPRAADQTDYQRGDDRSLFFAVGTAYNEITVIPVLNEKRLQPMRATTEQGLNWLLDHLRGVTSRWTAWYSSSDYQHGTRSPHCIGCGYLRDTPNHELGCSWPG